MGLLSDVRGRKKIVDVLVTHCSKLCVLSYIIGIIWLCALSDRTFNGRVYFSENALLPGLVEAEFKNHRLASELFGKLSTLPEGDISNAASQMITNTMENIGLYTYQQNFTVYTPFPGISEPHVINGVNIYGILRAPRIAGTEALVISVPYNQGNNKGALALMLSFADHCRRKSYWSKDIIFLVTDRDQLGMQAWLDAYHGVTNSYISSAPLEGHSGSIQAALNLEFLHEKVNFFKIAIEGINGQLPNLDLVNTVFRMCRKEHVPVSLHTEGYHEHLGPWADSVQSLVTMVIMMFYQASGRASGNHGLFHRYRIEAVTMRGGGETFQYGRGFQETGRVIEGIFRSLNNLLEQFHQSFFFYLLPESNRYVSIGLYMPPFGCLLLGPLIMAIVMWVLAGSAPENGSKVDTSQDEASKEEAKFKTAEVESREEKSGDTEKEIPNLEVEVAFLKYPPDIGSVVPIAMATHVAGVVVFYSPELSYKLGQATGLDPLLCTYVGMAFSFLVVVLLPFITRYSSDVSSHHVTLRSHYMLKCGALILFSVLMGAMAAINFSLAFLVSMFQVPVYLLVAPWGRRSRRLLQAVLLVLVSPPMILFLLSLAYNVIVSQTEANINIILQSTLTTVYQTVTSSIKEARMLGTWSFAMTCLGILPNWLMFWCLAWR
ncbi:glycosylphosphatidylinositol anchor attachment 1 protein-like isoform X1 [Pocillopora damicornis]|uniref:glycosylphosphatidylinositol anchor attachment 1 protein-like isoform X1 n=1 Tax=Pocillopora damicornis TaxID=46731 RepID=UPI000F553A05|nr:glycosylphosphatidylinositol anchor attachment 1 protein-like isoform X1 [Pocillopora damicornis]